MIAKHFGFFMECTSFKHSAIRSDTTLGKWDQSVLLSNQEGASPPGNFSLMWNCLRVCSSCCWLPAKYAAIALWKRISWLCKTFTWGKGNKNTMTNSKSPAILKSMNIYCISRYSVSYSILFCHTKSHQSIKYMYLKYNQESLMLIGIESKYVLINVWVSIFGNETRFVNTVAMVLSKQCSVCLDDCTWLRSEAKKSLY